MTIFNVLVIIFWLVFLVYWAISAFKTKKNVGSISKWIGIRALVALIVIALLHSQIISWFRGYHLVVTANPIINTIGIVLCGLGIAFAIWARYYLGRNWGMPMSVKEEPELVTAGPYAYVRHPIYTAVLVAILGLALVSGIGWFIVFVLSCVYFFYSAKSEEKLMMQKFPNHYPDYMKRTKMLIPFIL